MAMDEARMFRDDPVAPGWRYCAICGAEGYDVRPFIGLYRKVDGSGTEYAEVTRCKDTFACRARCEAAGDVWPLVESRAPRWEER